MQVLFENLPVALAAVDCDGNETSITECRSNNRLIGRCTNITSSTVLACANTAGGRSSHAQSCSSLHRVCMCKVHRYSEPNLCPLSLPNSGAT